MRRGLDASVLVFAMAIACKKEAVTLDAGPAAHVVNGATSATPTTLGKSLSQPAAGERFVVKLERDPCYGLCPSYTVEVDADGAVRYHGRKFVGVRGPVSSRVDAAGVSRLVMLRCLPSRHCPTHFV